MEQTTYVGFYNYVKNDLPMVKMITDEYANLSEAVKSCQDHSCVECHPLNSYHISIYLNGNKVGESNLANYRI